MGSRRSTDRDADGERRIASRERLPAHAFFSADGLEGRGVLRDLSVKGARIDKASRVLAPGTRIRLLLAVREDCFPMEIEAEVVRETKSGFAIEFAEGDPRLRAYLEFAVSSVAERATDDDEDTEPEIPRPRD